MTFSAQSLGSLGLLIGGKDRKPFVFSFGQEVKEPPCPVCVWACFLHTSAFFLSFLRALHVFPLQVCKDCVK